MRILLVEDEASLREIYTEVLTEAGYTVDQAADGETAVAKINAGNWDLMLLDIMLPKMDGMTVLKDKTSNPALRDKPVLIISNLENDEIMKQCLLGGASDYLVKSNMNPQELVDHVNKYFTHA